ncbi:ComEC/Rec2 family competence protein [Gilvibacter sp.]|uniref:ComEC/Rec2 family competence protein n=1 Tax=Gilvibacter sp. TaxID=2729997 RepID=UPI0025BBCA82|nr:ComEC/Rec2 family competence protein [Gilvibacter sp.]NQX77198.1 ComEC/Rec2 family competence protein [Gilvibacter sp.]
MEFLSFPLVRLGILFLCGILLGDWIQLPLESIAFVTGLLFVLLWVSRSISSTPNLKKWSFTILAYSLTFFCGVLLISHANKRFENTQEHHTKTYRPGSLVELQIEQLLSESPYYLKYKAQLNYPGSHKDLPILIRVKKDESCFYFFEGSVWQTTALVKLIEGPKNPADFNYANYLKYQHIAFDIKATADQFLQLSEFKPALSHYPKLWQRYWVALLETKLTQSANFELLAALLLGYKSQLRPETKAQFAHAGIAHLLAVSGLHLGIVVLFASWVLAFLKRLPQGKIIYALFLLLCLWGFAFMSGASISVLRAATMFTCLIVGKILGRYHGINSLFTSLWILLLIDPFYALQVGFQLSYAAVFFILWLLPKWNLYCPTKHSIGFRIWQWIGLSLIAQLGTAPLSLYYFHEFPTYFLVTNLVVVPAIGIVLIGGLLSLGILAVWPDFTFPLIALEWTINALRSFTAWIADLPASTIDTPLFGNYSLIGLLLSTLVLGHLFVRRSKRALPALVFIVVAIAGIWQLELPQERTDLILSEQFGQTTLWQINGRSLAVFSTSSQKETYSLQAFRRKNRIEEITEQQLPSIFYYRGCSVLVVDGSYPVDASIESIDILLLSQNARIHLDRWIRHYQPQMILADGSSYASYKARWAASAKKERLPFYDTSQQGAFVFE